MRKDHTPGWLISANRLTICNKHTSHTFSHPKYIKTHDLRYQKECVRNEISFVLNSESTPRKYFDVHYIHYYKDNLPLWKCSSSYAQKLYGIYFVEFRLNFTDLHDPSVQSNLKINLFVDNNNFQCDFDEEVHPQNLSYLCNT
ncbi:hypothetical protein RF11_01872 [Thelohanellus kitauei]|uniref:Uncharacterized protein n=1 Tax=Thelohanellus kitauei TaxID=669202 RepID=A0A0C2J224_THEKT|nr:hypothetical protein RF11_01872 [Thelohanellus kitauei]